METLAFLCVPNMFCIICKILVKWTGTRKHIWLKHCATRLKVAGLIVAVVIEWTYSFQPQFRPANDSACKRNRCQTYLLGHEGIRCVWLKNLTALMCRLSRKPGRLKLIHPQRLVQVCTGIALPVF